MTLEEKGLDYEVFEEDLSDLSPAILSLHPEGKVPLLIHDGFPIHESSIITEYLDEAFPKPVLRPATARGLAVMRLWTYWCNELFKPDLDAFKYPKAEVCDAENAALLERLQEHLKKLAVPLSRAPYLLGPDLTLADIHLFPFYRQILKARPNAPELLRPASVLDEWLNRITSRPSFERVMKKRI